MSGRFEKRDARVVRRRLWIVGAQAVIPALVPLLIWAGIGLPLALVMGVSVALFATSLTLLLSKRTPTRSAHSPPRCDSMARKRSRVMP